MLTGRKLKKKYLFIPNIFGTKLCREAHTLEIFSKRFVLIPLGVQKLHTYLQKYVLEALGDGGCALQVTSQFLLYIQDIEVISPNMCNTKFCKTTYKTTNKLGSPNCTDMLKNLLDTRIRHFVMMIYKIIVLEPL